MRIIRKQFFERKPVKMDTRKMYDEIVDYFMACGQDSGDWNIDVVPARKPGISNA